MQHDGAGSEERIRGIELTRLIDMNLENANNSFRKVFVVKAARASTFGLLLNAAPDGHRKPLEFHRSFRRITIY